MPGIAVPPLENETGQGAGSRNLQASASLWFAIAAIVLFLLYLQVRAAPIRAAFLFGLPVSGGLAVVFGIAGLVRARRTGIGRAEASVGLGLGICILVLTGIIGVVILEISHLPSNGF